MNYEFRIGLWLAVLLVLMAGCKKDEQDTDYPTDGLVSYFSFEDHLLDAAGSTPGGTAYGGAEYINGHYGKALDLNGTNQYVLFNHEHFGQDNRVGISFWFKSGQIGEWSTLVECSDLAVRTHSDHIYFSIYNGLSPGLAIATFTEDTWTNVTGTYDGATIRIFINGVLDDDNDYTAVLDRQGYPLAIGFHVENLWRGSIDELFIYNKALTQDEITALYER
ncbi:MAG: LamG domain-containing protein [Bacteroidetes bacterium]|nr:LamG domain-containing protein [Bacteroidota bacterium]